MNDSTLTGRNVRQRYVTPIVALDVPTGSEARALVETLGSSCNFYKVGLELFAAEGPSIVGWIRDQGHEVFVDLKLHDIPNTVRSAARAVARSGASLLTVHAAGGAEMIRAAVDGAHDGAGVTASSARGCAILAVTILTSLDATLVARAWGRQDAVDVADEVIRLARLAEDATAAGVVCSGHEAQAVRGVCGDAFGILVPGIRLAGGDSHDQRRVTTPAAAAAAGARWIILGRAVTAAADPKLAMEMVAAALAEVP